MIELMSEERLEKFLAESCCQHGEACNDVYAAEVRAELARLRAEVERLWPWALNDFKECPDCIKCVACGGLGELCESHSAFVWDGCDCEPAQ